MVQTLNNGIQCRYGLGISRRCFTGGSSDCRYELPVLIAGMQCKSALFPTLRKRFVRASLLAIFATTASAPSRSGTCGSNVSNVAPRSSSKWATNRGHHVEGFGATPCVWRACTSHWWFFTSPILARNCLADSPFMPSKAAAIFGVVSEGVPSTAASTAAPAGAASVPACCAGAAWGAVCLLATGRVASTYPLINSASMCFANAV